MKKNNKGQQKEAKVYNPAELMKILVTGGLVC